MENRIHKKLQRRLLGMNQATICLKYLGIVGYVLVCLFLLVIPQLQFAKAKDKEKYYNGEVQEEA